MKSIYQAGALLIVLTIISGVLYPVAVTGIGQLFFAEKVNGSLIKSNNEIVGSALIGQKFTQPKYFWSRPSASSYNAVPSSATNLGPTSADLAKVIEKRRNDFAEVHAVPTSQVPLDMLTTSASGLDPHITLEAAQMQVKRIAHARGLDEKEQGVVDQLINRSLENPQLSIFGEQRVNVLSLNLGLDECCGVKR